jgi:hypothetical protein
MIEPQHAELLAQGLSDQARLAFNLVGSDDGLAIEAAIERATAAHRRWIEGQHPDLSDGNVELRMRLAFGYDPVVFGSPE